MMDAEEINQLYRVNKTLLKMLQDRGFVIPEKYNAMDEKQFMDKLGNPPSRQNLTLLFGLGANPEERIFVFFSGEKKLKVDHITSFGRRMHDENVLKAIIVIKGEITTLARQAMQEISQRFQVESFEEKDLLVNITEHELVPKHIKLTPEEKQALLDRYRVKDSQLPKILLNDPVAKYYGLRKGEVVKIIRTSETAGKYITYRLVV